MKKILLGLVLCIFFGGLFACMKNPDMTPDYGAEVSLADIQKAVNSDAPMDLLSMKKNQYVSIDETQAVDTQLPGTISQRLDQLITYEDLPAQINVTFKINLKEYVGGQWKESTQTSPPLAITKNSGAASVAKLTKSTLANHKASLPLTLQSLRKMQSSSASKITYHNLVRSTGIMPVPEVVKAHPNCGGVLKCDVGLRYLRVSFDQVVWDTPDHGIKTSFKITYSPDIPVYIHDWDNMTDVYPTNQFQSCAQTWLEIQNGDQKQTVPVLQCAEIRDFQFGT